MLVNLGFFIILVVQVLCCEIYWPLFKLEKLKYFRKIQRHELQCLTALLISHLIFFQLKWEAPNEEELVKFLVEEKGFK